MEDLLPFRAREVPRVVSLSTVGASGPRCLAPPMPLQALVRGVAACTDAAGLLPLPALGPYMPVALAPITAQWLPCVRLQLVRAVPAQIQLAGGGAFEGDEGVPRLLPPPRQQAPRRGHTGLPLQVAHGNAPREVTHDTSFIEGRGAFGYVNWIPVQ